MPTTLAGLLGNQQKIAKTLWDTFGNNPRNQETVDAMKGMLGLLPLGAGDAASGLLAADDVRRGDYASAGLNGVGVLPYIPALGGIIGGYGKHAEDIAKVLNQKHPNIDADLMGGNVVTLAKVIAKEKNKGSGTSFMQDLVSEADKNNVPVALSPASDFGGNKKRLQEFYKRFGFVENKGRNKDFTISESMYREPIK